MSSSVHEPLLLPMRTSVGEESDYPESWYALCAARSVARGAVRVVRAFGTELVVYRDEEGAVGVLDAYCMHMGTYLGNARVDGKLLRCPLHHWSYDRSGRCRRGPAAMCTDGAPRQPAFVCEEHYGIVFIFWGVAPSFPLPRPPIDGPERATRPWSTDFDVNYQVLGANSFDRQHFPSVHGRTTEKNFSLAQPAPHQITLDFTGTVVIRGLYDRVMRLLGGNEVNIRIDCYGGNYQIAANPRLGTYVLATATPIDARRTRMFLVTIRAVRGRGPFGSLIDRLRLFVSGVMIRAFLRADMRVVNRMRFEQRRLLPGYDDSVIQWLRYIERLPRYRLAAKGRP